LGLTDPSYRGKLKQEKKNKCKTHKKKCTCFGKQSKQAKKRRGTIISVKNINSPIAVMSILRASE